jgi:type II secretory ATPase GspE/PulE/Tfp pilus assembly ATPase PilB-like protein
MSTTFTGTVTDIPFFVRQMFFDAENAHASDVHVEPTSQSIHIRFRIDGILTEYASIPLFHHEQLLSHLKVLASLNVNAIYVPQDGQFSFTFSGNDSAGTPYNNNVTIRISVFPTINGDAAVFRLASATAKTFSLDSLGMTPLMLQKVRNILAKNYGMFLITGPVGSGKTTALYSALNETRTSDKNIVTLEDPVEIRFDNIRQIEIHPEHGLTFALGMKSILRQDPDVIMIGEIRDKETAEHAVRAALVGRTVFSSIHTNSSIGTIARLIDMGIEKSMIAYALNGVISSRLVRKNCDYCKQAYTPSPEFCAFFGVDPNKHTFMRGTGCNACDQTGTIGRTGIFEVLEFESDLRTMIVDGASINELQKHVERNGTATIKQDALEKILAGTITMENAVHAI